MKTLRLATAASEPELEAAVTSALLARGDLEVVLRCVDRVELLALARGGAVDAILVVGVPGWADPQCFEECATNRVRVVAVTDDPAASEKVRRRGGCVVPRDSAADVIFAACGASAPLAPKPTSTQPSTPRGKIVAVWGPKGGPGRTTIAAELAAELAAVARDTLLVDADPYGGDMIQLAGILEEVATVIWAAQMAGKEELDAARLALDLRRIGSAGPVILPGIPRSELWPEVSDFGWRQLLVVARASFTFTVCDVGFCLEPDPSPYPGSTEGRNRMARATVAAADQAVAVCRADPVGVKNFLWSFEQLTTLVPPDDVYVVANRVRPGTEREIGDLLRRHLGKRPVAYIPDRPQELALAVRQGAPVREVKPGSDICSGIRGLAAALGARVPPRGLMTRLAGRK